MQHVKLLAVASAIAWRVMAALEPLPDTPQTYTFLPRCAQQWHTSGSLWSLLFGFLVSAAPSIKCKHASRAYVKDKHDAGHSEHRTATRPSKGAMCMWGEMLLPLLPLLPWLASGSHHHPNLCAWPCCQAHPECYQHPNMLFSMLPPKHPRGPTHSSQ
jgi:hypothetical protein